MNKLFRKISLLIAMCFTEMLIIWLSSRPPSLQFLRFHIKTPNTLRNKKSHVHVIVCYSKFVTGKFARVDGLSKIKFAFIPFNHACFEAFSLFRQRTEPLRASISQGPCKFIFSFCSHSQQKYCWRARCYLRNSHLFWINLLTYLV